MLPDYDDHQLDADQVALQSLLEEQIENAIASQGTDRGWHPSDQEIARMKGVAAWFRGQVCRDPFGTRQVFRPDEAAYIQAIVDAITTTYAAAKENLPPTVVRRLRRNFTDANEAAGKWTLINFYS